MGGDHPVVTTRQLRFQSLFTVLLQLKMFSGPLPNFFLQDYACSARPPLEKMVLIRLGRVRSVVAALVQPSSARFFSGTAKPAAPHPDRVHLKECKRVVIKVGTAVVSNANGTLVGFVLDSAEYSSG
jgi:hypothetical protein